MKPFERMPDEEIRKQLNFEQIQVVCNEGTEPPFQNRYWNCKRPGIYVDVLSGEPLFSSAHKYDSGSGWPSFFQPLIPEHVIEKEDHKFGMNRVEVRSKHGNAHLGHVFPDGPEPTGLRYCINSASLKFIPFEELRFTPYFEYEKNFSDQYDFAVLAGGCFWGVQHLLRDLPGVVYTEVGYTGGHTEFPLYSSVKTGQTGHTEAVRIVFDKRKFSYEKLLDFFFRLHDPTTLNQQGNDLGTQYRSAIFFNSPGQKKTAEDLIARVQKSGLWKNPVVTELTELKPFYRAEEIHQDYLVHNPDGYNCHYIRSEKAL